MQLIILGETYYSALYYGLWSCFSDGYLFSKPLNQAVILQIKHDFASAEFFFHCADSNADMPRECAMLFNAIYESPKWGEAHTQLVDKNVCVVHNGSMKNEDQLWLPHNWPDTTSL